MSDLDEFYGVFAQYFDLLYADTVQERYRQPLACLTGAARLGVLDVAAGTGLSTAVLADLCPGVPVFALEPSTSMRIGLYGRLAADPVLRARTTVLGCRAEDLKLVGAVDVAACLDATFGLPAAVRQVVWARIARALTPGGVLVTDFPPAGAGTVRAATERLVGEVRVGRHTIRASFAVEPDGERQLWVFRARTFDDSGSLIENQTSTGVGYPCSGEERRSELAAAGFVVERMLSPPDREQLLLARLEAG